MKVQINTDNHVGGGQLLTEWTEAALEGMQPVAVTHRAATLREAVDGAAGKLKASLETTLGRLSSR